MTLGAALSTTAQRTPTALDLLNAPRGTLQLRRASSINLQLPAAGSFTTASRRASATNAVWPSSQSVTRGSRANSPAPGSVTTGGMVGTERRASGGLLGALIGRRQRASSSSSIGLPLPPLPPSVSSADAAAKAGKPDAAAKAGKPAGRADGKPGSADGSESTDGFSSSSGLAPTTLAGSSPKRSSDGSLPVVGGDGAGHGRHSSSGYAASYLGGTSAGGVPQRNDTPQPSQLSLRPRQATPPASDRSTLTGMQPAVQQSPPPATADEGDGLEALKDAAVQDVLHNLTLRFGQRPSGDGPPVKRTRSVGGILIRPRAATVTAVPSEAETGGAVQTAPSATAGLLTGASVQAAGWGARRAHTSTGFTLPDEAAPSGPGMTHVSFTNPRHAHLAKAWELPGPPSAVTEPGLAGAVHLPRASTPGRGGAAAADRPFTRPPMLRLADHQADNRAQTPDWGHLLRRLRDGDDALPAQAAPTTAGGDDAPTPAALERDSRTTRPAQTPSSVRTAPRLLSETPPASPKDEVKPFPQPVGGGRPGESDPGVATASAAAEQSDLLSPLPISTTGSRPKRRARPPATMQQVLQLEDIQDALCPGTATAATPSSTGPSSSSSSSAAAPAPATATATAPAVSAAGWHAAPAWTRAQVHVAAGGLVDADAGSGGRELCSQPAEEPAEEPMQRPISPVEAVGQAQRAAALGSEAVQAALRPLLSLLGQVGRNGVAFVCFNKRK